MASDPLPRSPGWSIGAGGVVLLMIFIAVRTILDARHPGGYQAAHWHGPWIYPTEAVAAWLSVMAIEGFAICGVLRARVSAPLAVRAVFLAAGMFLVLLVLSPLAMHAGPPIAEHIGWMGMAMLWLLAFALGSGVASLVRRLCARSRRGGPA